MSSFDQSNYLWVNYQTNIKNDIGYNSDYDKLKSLLLSWGFDNVKTSGLTGAWRIGLWSNDMGYLLAWSGVLKVQKKDIDVLKFKAKNGSYYIYWKEENGWFTLNTQAEFGEDYYIPIHELGFAVFKESGYRWSNNDFSYYGWNIFNNNGGISVDSASSIYNARYTPYFIKKYNISSLFKSTDGEKITISNKDSIFSNTTINSYLVNKIGIENYTMVLMRENKADEGEPDKDSYHYNVSDDDIDKNSPNLRELMFGALEEIPYYLANVDRNKNNDASDAGALSNYLSVKNDILYYTDNLSGDVIKLPFFTECKLLAYAREADENSISWSGTGYKHISSAKYYKEEPSIYIRSSEIGDYGISFYIVPYEQRTAQNILIFNPNAKEVINRKVEWRTKTNIYDISKYFLNSEVNYDINEYRFIENNWDSFNAINNTLYQSIIKEKKQTTGYMPFLGDKKDSSDISFTFKEWKTIDPSVHDYSATMAFKLSLGDNYDISAGIFSQNFPSIKSQSDSKRLQYIANIQYIKNEPNINIRNTSLSTYSESIYNVNSTTRVNNTLECIQKYRSIESGIYPKNLGLLEQESGFKAVTSSGSTIASSKFEYSENNLKCAMKTSIGTSTDDYYINNYSIGYTNNYNGKNIDLVVWYPTKSRLNFNDGTFGNFVIAHPVNLKGTDICCCLKIDSRLSTSKIILPYCINNIVDYIKLDIDEDYIGENKYGNNITINYSSKDKTVYFLKNGVLTDIDYSSNYVLSNRDVSLCGASSNSIACYDLTNTTGELTMYFKAKLPSDGKWHQTAKKVGYLSLNSSGSITLDSFGREVVTVRYTTTSYTDKISIITFSEAKVSGTTTTVPFMLTSVGTMSVNEA